MTKHVLEYIPRPQFAPFHARHQRFSSLVCHRRAGKTVACVNDLVAKALLTKKKNARYAYVAPFYRQAKDVAWTYLKEAAGEIATKVREADLRIELPNGAWITLYGADNPDALRGLYFDGIILDEFGDCRPALWAEVILPTLLDRKGWAVFIGTPKGKNHFYQMNERAKAEASWYQMTLRASDSAIIDMEDLLEIKGQMTPDQYDQEMECSFDAAVQGTYYASMINELEEQGRFGEFYWDPTQPVHVSSDLGFTDSTAFWFWQIAPDGIKVIDYEEASGKSLPFYFDLLTDKGYNYDTIWLPHDAKAKSLQTGRSTIEQFVGYFRDQHEVRVDIIPKLAVQHGIDAARKVLPLCWFNAVACYDGIEALRAYRRGYNEVTKQFGKVPVHDWASNGADAFRGLALVTQERLQPTQKEAIVPETLLKPRDYRLDDLFKERERGSWRDQIIRI
jgi:hypothetical protein